MSQNGTGELVAFVPDIIHDYYFNTDPTWLKSGKFGNIVHKYNIKNELVAIGEGDYLLDGIIYVSYS